MNFQEEIFLDKFQDMFKKKNLKKVPENKIERQH